MDTRKQYIFKNGEFHDVVQDLIKKLPLFEKGDSDRMQDIIDNLPCFVHFTSEEEGFELNFLFTDYHSETLSGYQFNSGGLLSISGYVNTNTIFHNFWESGTIGNIQGNDPQLQHDYATKGYVDSVAGLPLVRITSEDQDLTSLVDSAPFLLFLDYSDDDLNQIYLVFYYEYDSTEDKITLFRAFNMASDDLGSIYSCENTTQGKTLNSLTLHYIDFPAKNVVENMINTSETSGLYYSTTAPTANNTNGKLKVVVLSSEPATRYSGYLYIITGSNS